MSQTTSKKTSKAASLDTMKKALDKINNEIKKYLVGQQGMIDLILTGLLARGHILLEGVPGIAKTLSAKLVAKTLSTNFSRIQFTPDLMPSDILGTNIFNVKKSQFEFKEGPIFSNIILIDEINRSPAKTQAALFEVMEERQVTVDGKTYTMDEPFIVLATQNPIEYEGTYRLPEAQVDRFIFKIKVDYPNLEEEIKILQNANEKSSEELLSQIKPVITEKAIQSLRKIVRSVHVDENILKYIAEIVNNTRSHNALFLGGSPRASLSIMEGSKAYAALQGRDFIIPEDIQFIVYPALRHRLLLFPEKEMEGLTPEDIIGQIIENIEVPR